MKSILKYISVVYVLVCLFLPSSAQYKRRGETLQSRGAKTAKPKKADYTIDQFMGKWQEFQRMNRSDNSVVSFNDSIQLKFSDSNKVMIRTSIVNSMTLVGDAEIGDNNLLTVGADEYTVKTFANNEMLLDDNEQFMHHMRKVDTFWYETLGKTSVKPDEFTTPVSTSINNILGKWFVYRRNAKPGAVNETELLIKNLNITRKTGESTAVGDMVFYQGKNSQQAPCTVTLHGGNIKIVAGSNIWNLSVYQADANNFVFGNSNLLYYCKPSKN